MFGNRSHGGGGVFGMPSSKAASVSAWDSSDADIVAG